MKEIALVADLHGNLPATMAADADIRSRGIEEIWCLGDLVGKGPNSADTFDWAVEHCRIILRGNWDEGVGMKLFDPNDRYYYRQLGEKRMRMLTEFPLEHCFSASGQKIRLIHGRPAVQSCMLLSYPEEELASYFDPDLSVLGFADYHRQGLRILKGGRQLFNTGSVGNGIGLPMVQYTILRFCECADPAPLDIVFVTLPYDTGRAVRDAAESDDLPRRDCYIREIQTGIYSR